MDIEVFTFRDGFAGRGAATHVCIGSRAQIEPLVPLTELDELVYGYALYEGEDGNELVGVWGARNTARLRRLLNDRGALVRRVHGHPAARLKRWITHGKARAVALR